MTKIFLLAAALGFSAEAGTPGHEKAEDRARMVPGGASKGLSACHDDIERLCRDVEPGDGRLGACLKENRKKLSKKCLRWAAHGGKKHVDASLLDIDRTPAPKR